MSEPKDFSVILEEWEALANAATPGPWFWDSRGQFLLNGDSESDEGQFHDDAVLATMGTSAVTDETKAFIASTRTSNPLLIKALRRAMKFIDGTRIFPVDKRRIETDITAILNGEKQ